MAVNDSTTTDNSLDEWFDKNFYELRSYGNVEYHVAYKAFLDTLKNEKDKITGKLVTKEFLVDKYTEYIKFKESLPRYTSGKEKEIVSIYDWLMGKMWTHRYKIKQIANDKRDDYLFGIDY